MTDPRTATQELQAQILDSIRKSQEAVVDALRTWAEAVHSVTPSLPVSAVPFADKLPKPSELVADAYRLRRTAAGRAAEVRRGRDPDHRPRDGRRDPGASRQEDGRQRSNKSQKPANRLKRRAR